MNPLTLNLLKYGSGTVATALLSSNLIEHKMKEPDRYLYPPVDKVTIVIPSYNEERFIELCLSSLRNQSISHEYPEYFEYLLVDSQSTDRTVELAEPYVDKIIVAPRGKLTARNLGTDQAKGNIIVSVDSDTYYSYHWLNSLLKPFYDPGNAAVVGSTLDFSIPNIPKTVYLLSATIDRYVIHPTQMVGRNSAYWKHLFYKVGMFNTNLNQQSIHDVLKEEEINFGKRLSKLGKVVFQLNASCIHLGGQKIACRWGISDGKLCNEYGIGIRRFG